MAAYSTLPIRDVSSGKFIEPQADEGDPTIGSYEPVRPSEAPAQQGRSLAPSPDRLMLIGGGVGAAFLGGAVGYWLGRRRSQPPTRPIRKVAANVETALGLAPLAMSLLSNPMIRALAIRIVLRQLSRRIEH